MAERDADNSGNAAFRLMIDALKNDADRRHRLWERRCKGKYCHASPAAAQREVERLEEKFPGEEYNWYVCHDCKKIHVGHTPPWVKEKEHMVKLIKECKNDEEFYGRLNDDVNNERISPIAAAQYARDWEAQKAKAAGAQPRVDKGAVAPASAVGGAQEEVHGGNGAQQEGVLPTLEISIYGELQQGRTHKA